MKPPFFQRVRSAAQGAAWLVRPGGLKSQLATLINQDAQSHDHQSREIARLQQENQSLREQLSRQQQRDQRAKWIEVGDLRAFERRVSSQNGEDGIIEELFRRIGATNRYFVEIGAETGEECNCGRLVREEGWTGLFVEADSQKHARLCQVYRPFPLIRCANAFVQADQVDLLLDEQGVPAEPDLLSIDIDGNDYWVWKAIRRRPRVVIIEYNADYAAPRRWVMQPNPNHAWDGTNYYGASLASLVALGRNKGYMLVATDSTGVNAFFVRDDLCIPGRFLDTMLHYYYSPMNNPLCPGGHRPRSGPFVEV